MIRFGLNIIYLSNIYIMKIVIITPAGRKKYLKILLKNLIKQKDDFDEWHLWNNTRNKEDEIYIKDLEKNYGWIKCISRNIPDPLKGWITGIHYFWDYVNKSDTCYIRLDDDIVWLENNFIKTLVNFKIENKENPIVYGNIVNNNLIDHKHQKLGCLNLNFKIPFETYSDIFFSDSNTVIKIHQQFQNDIKNNKINNWKFDKLLIPPNKYCAINAICWFGKDITSEFYNNFNLKPNVNLKELGWQNSEEYFLTITYLNLIKKQSLICGDALCVHASFSSQLKKVNKEEFEKIIQNYENLTI